MERHFNTLKNECANLYEFQTEEALYQTVEEFAYVTYNHVRPCGYRQEPGVRGSSSLHIPYAASVSCCRI